MEEGLHFSRGHAQGQKHVAQNVKILLEEDCGVFGTLDGTAA